MGELSSSMRTCSWEPQHREQGHYNDVIMGAIGSQITSLTIVYSTVYSGADQRKHQSYASLAFVLGIHRGPVNSPHKWPVTRKMFPFDDVIVEEPTLIARFMGPIWGPSEADRTQVGPMNLAIWVLFNSHESPLLAFFYDVGISHILW